jgi:predicted acylesterase/phospholipase RssA
LHHHVQWKDQTHMERLARFLTGRSIGLVLSGGATRGYTHVGVIKALQEYGIPIDIVGSASSGALIGAQFAMGRGYDEILDLNIKWIDRKSIRRLTFPIVSIASDRRYEQALCALFDEARYEDLY